MEFQHISIFCDLQLTTRRRFFKEQWQYAIRNLIPVKQHQLTKQHYLYLLSTNRFLWKLVWHSQNLNSFINFIYSNCIGTPKGSSCNLSLSLSLWICFQTICTSQIFFILEALHVKLIISYILVWNTKCLWDYVFYASLKTWKFVSNIIINQMEYDAVFHNKNTCDTRRDFTWIQNQDLVPLVGEYGEHLG